VFLSHTSEFRIFPQGGSYIAAVERAVSKAGHAIVDMVDFAAQDQEPAQVCEERVQASDLYVGIYGSRYGSPVRDRPEVSYTELEFDTATAAGIPRLVFLLDDEAENPGIPGKWLRDNAHGSRQEAFLKRVQDAGLTLSRFRNPDDLRACVYQALQEEAQRQRHSAQKMAALQSPAQPKTATGRFGVFLSYARSDGEAFANEGGAPDGRLASVSGDRTIKLWDPASGEAGSSQQLFVADAAITALAFLSGASILVAGDASGRLHWLQLGPS
jgi:hypothetical protein